MVFIKHSLRFVIKVGLKDTKKRNTKNYRLREMRKRKASDEAKGIFKPIEEYIM